MKLTYHSDYALRVLLYLGLQEEDVLVRTKDIAAAFNISLHHLVKVVLTLAEHGFVEVKPGRGGGIRLGRDPKDLTLGAVLRVTENDFDYLECFNSAQNRCRISPFCAVKGKVQEAHGAFMKVLDGYTIADCLAKPGPQVYEAMLRMPPPTSAVRRITKRPLKRKPTKS